MANVLWFKEITKENRDIVGGKASNLGGLFNLSLPVPAGFVVTSEAYKLFLEESEIENQIEEILDGLNVDNTEALQNSAKKIQNIILNAKMPSEVKNEIIENYDNLNISPKVFENAGVDALNIIKAGRDNAYVAVRSSATAEDLPSIDENSHVLIKANGKPIYDTIRNIYNKIGDGNNCLIEVAAMQDNKIKWMKAQQVYKHPAKNKKLFKIITETGREITITENHSLIVLDKDILKPKIICIRDLEGDEMVPVTKKIDLLNLDDKEIDVLDYVKGKDLVCRDDLVYIKNNSTNWKIQKPLSRKLKITKDLAYFLGLYCAEGSTYESNCSIITSSNNKVITKIRRFLKSISLCNNQALNKHSIRIYSKTLVRLLHQLTGTPLKIKGKGRSCRIKHVPDFIFGCNKEIIGSFLAGCYDGDGYISKSSIGYCSISEKLIGGIVKLLEMLNIYFYIRRKGNILIINIPPFQAKKFRDLIRLQNVTKLSKLNELVGFYNKKGKNLEFLNPILISDELSKRIKVDFDNKLEKSNVEIGVCPLCKKELENNGWYKNRLRFYCRTCKKIFYEGDIKKETVKRYIYYDKRGRFKKGMSPWNEGVIKKNKLSRYRFKKLMKKYRLDNYLDFLSGDVLWDRIKKVEEIIYNGDVYDFSVPGLENFAAGLGGIITHNTASFAGQMKTFLNVKGENNVVEAVQKCWASLFTARAIYYRVKNNFEHMKVFIAVIVQKMVDSDKSGVVFTINPSTNNTKEIVIEAGFGLGDAIVGGEIIPDSYIVDKDRMKIKDIKVNEQDWMYIRDEFKRVTVKRRLSESNKSKQVLNEHEILKLSEFAKKIEDHYGKPQDIEFAIEGSRIFIVQTRDVTTLKKPTEVEEEKGLEVVSEVIVKGLGASRGVASGPVKIIHSIEELVKINEGDVAVTRMTNPDMTPAMKKAAAIITDEGGSTCFSGDTKILTNKGFMELKDAYEKYEKGGFFIFSYAYNKMKPTWKFVKKVTKRKSNLIRVACSQKGLIEHNTLDLTEDHKIYTFDGRELIKKEVGDIIKAEEMVCVVDKLPYSDNVVTNFKLAYIMGVVLSDGHVKVDYHHTTNNPRRGSITLTQKESEDRIGFIEHFKNTFSELFGGTFKSSQKAGYGNIRGRVIYGEAVDYTLYNLKTALFFKNIIQNLDNWTLKLDECCALNYLAGLIDGDGCFSNNRLHIYVSKENVLRSVMLACLRLGILPQITVNRNIHHVQILERMSDIINFTKRVKGNVHEKKLGNKLFSAKQLLKGIENKVNWEGKIKAYVRDNRLVDCKKVIERITLRCDKKDKIKLLKIMDSYMRMQRIGKIENIGKSDVYNLEVEAKSEMQHNYVVFTKKYTPILVSNCHAAIISREMGIPAIVGTSNATHVLKDGQIVTVDAINGRVYEGKVEVKEKVKEEIKPIVGEEFETITKIKVILDLPEYAEKVATETNADGIGLVRIEFMIVENKIHPNKYIKENRVEEYVNLLENGLEKIASAFKDKPVWVRTTDMRTDEYRNLEGGEEEPEESDPMIGWHGIRRGLDQKELLKAEFRAIKNLHDKGYKNIGVMLPFLISLEELKRAKEILREVGLEPVKDIEFGVMIETPASCLIIEDLCKEGISFISIGSNDLTQLTLGLDRNNERIAKLFDEMNIAVLREIRNVVKVCKKYNVKSSICGQAGSKEEMAEFLVKIGIDSIAANADAVSKIRKVVARTERKLMLEAAREKYESEGN